MTSQIFNKFRLKLHQIFIEKPSSMGFLPSPRNLLIGSLFLLISIGLLMIASASIPYATSKGMAPLHYFYSQIIYVILGLFTGFIAYKLPLRWYHTYEGIFFAVLGCVILLGLTLFTSKTNGASRWLDLGPVSFQAAEVCKVVMIFSAAEYAVRRSVDVRVSVLSAWRLLLFYVPVVGLLLAQPDFGSFVLITLITIIILFVAGTPIKQIGAILLAAMSVIVIQILFSGYRLKRWISFLDPMADANDSGFQVVNALVGFARGDIFGLGYGDSIQKLSYLPEAHTDFLLAVAGEELGFLGTASVIVLEFLVVASMMAISFNALKRRQLRISYAVFGLATLIFGQTFINAGMNLGVSPAKGLTLPFFSYGGSSILVLMTLMGYVLKADKVSLQIHQNKKSAEY